MRTETISFKEFMAGPYKKKTFMETFRARQHYFTITAPGWVEGRLDNGLTFFIGMGIVLLGIVALEHQGVEINEGLVRFCLWTGLAVFTGWAILNTTFFRSVMYGF